MDNVLLKVFRGKQHVAYFYYGSVQVSRVAGKLIVNKRRNDEFSSMVCLFRSNSVTERQRTSILISSRILLVFSWNLSIFSFKFLIPLNMCNIFINISEFVFKLTDHLFKLVLNKGDSVLWVRRYTRHNILSYSLIKVT